MSPFDGTPAHRGGIRYGDQIVEINGESTEGWNSTQVSSKLIGPEGTPVTVKVSRPGEASRSSSNSSAKPCRCRRCRITTCREWRRLHQF